MGKERQKRKELRQLLSPLARFWHHDGRRYCAIALCASLIAGNIGHMAVAASEDPDYKFELDRVALYEALQQAVADGNTVDSDFDFQGLDADTYAIWMAADSSLYELTPEIEDNKGSLQLRVFARLGEDIELVDDFSEEIGSETSYEIDGSEEFYFFLTNTSNQEQTAVIRVGEKETELISVIPYSDVEVPEPEGKASAYALDAAVTETQTAGPGVETTESTGETSTGTVTSGGSGSSGSGSGGGGGSSGSSIKNETAADIEISTEAATETEIETETEVKVEETETVVSETPETEVNVPETETPESEAPAESEDSIEIENEAPKTDVDVTIDVEDSGTDVTEETDVSVVEDDKNAEAAVDTNETNDEEISSNDTGSSDDTADGNNDDAVSDTNDRDDSESVDVASISLHKTYRVASSNATPSNATPSDATPSDASASDMALDTLDGTVLNAVRLGDASAVIFVTTAEELKVSNDLKKFASPSNAGRLYEADLDAGLIVQVYANEDAFDEHVELSVKELKEDDEETAEDYQAAKDALDADNTEYSGMIALDISFLNDAGDEVEPKNGSVQVYIEMDKAILPDDVIEETLAVKHLEEDKHGNIETVNTVADNADAEVANVEVDAEAAVITAEFEVESFSTFTITWSGSNLVNTVIYFELTGYHYDDSNNRFTNLSNKTESLTLSNNTAEKALSDYAENITGYVYKEARYGAIDGSLVTRFTANQSGKGWNPTRTITFYNSDTEIISLTYSNNTTIEAEVYLIYEPTGPVILKDTVQADGCLTAVVNGVEKPEGMTYEWYEIAENGTETKITTTSTLDASSYKFDYARNGFNDDNLSKRFKVVVKDSTGSLVGEAMIEPDYHNALKNGSFEDPINSFTNAGPQYEVDEVPYWETTGLGSGSKDGQDIEILSVAKSDSRNNFNLTEQTDEYSRNTITSWTETENNTTYTVTGVVDGSQCAELNCEAWGALYQDIVTVPGSTLYWGFYHRGRFGTDTMQLIIQSSDAEMISAGQEYGTNQGAQTDENENVIFSANVADGWQYHSGSYVVPEGQYITRFYFVSVSCTNGGSQSTGGDSTVGNYLDYVTFGSDIPAPLPTRGNLTVTKAVKGISDTEIPTETFTFTVTGPDSYSQTVKLPTTNGEWSISLLNLKAGSYTIQETVTGNIDGYNHVAIKVGSEDVTSSGQISTTVVAGENQNVTFVNEYEPATTSITLDKVVAGKMGDRSKEFSFTVKINGEKSGDIYKLSHNTETVTISDIPLGSTVEITESDNSGYEVSATVSNTDSATVNGNVITFTASSASGHDVVVTNTKDPEVDTGVLLDSLPYVLILAAVIAGVAFYFIRKKKDDEDDLD